MAKRAEEQKGASPDQGAVPGLTKYLLQGPSVPGEAMLLSLANKGQAGNRSPTKTGVQGLGNWLGQE